MPTSHILVAEAAANVANGGKACLKLGRGEREKRVGGGIRRFSLFDGWEIHRKLKIFLFHQTPFSPSPLPNFKQALPVFATIAAHTPRICDCGVLCFCKDRPLHTKNIFKTTLGPSQCHQQKLISLRDSRRGNSRLEEFGLES